MRLEDYGLVGDCRTGALVSTAGSIDWMCTPRFDSPACFAALLGNEEHGCWQLCPQTEVQGVRRRYLGHSLILETEFRTATGLVRLIDFMPPDLDQPQVVRIAEGLEGIVPMRMKLTIRFDYGSMIPWVRAHEQGISAIAGPHSLYLHSDVPTHGKNLSTVAEFHISGGHRVAFVLGYAASHAKAPQLTNAHEALRCSTAWWDQWVGPARYRGPYRDAVLQSLVVLKGLTYAPTGGLVAALTTSLPEDLGGTRNWDYRFCWLRDATYTLYAFIEAGLFEEAAAWRDWLVRAVAGAPSQAQPLYAVDGDRWLDETHLPWLPGYENSRPVRIGNAAAGQLQLDLFGEVMDTLHAARARGLQPNENAWRVQKAMMRHLEEIWQNPDSGIWELRGEARQLTHSKVMVWVAFDRAVKAVERFGLDGPVERWRELRAAVHEQVCTHGFSQEKNSFVQTYGSDEVDASLLLIPEVGFLPANDPRVRGTIEAVERELMQDGLVRRYRTETRADRLPGDEGTFLLCSFWLADAWALTGRQKQAEQLFEHLLSIRNEVGLLSEEYDTAHDRLVGNFPQAFSHLGLINSARNLAAEEESPSEERAR